MVFPEKHIFICENKRPEGAAKPSCANHGGSEIREAIKLKLVELGLHKKYRINKAGCLGKCSFGPTLVIYPAGIWYGNVTLNDVDEIIEKSILNDEVIERLSLNHQPVKLAVEQQSQP